MFLKSDSYYVSNVVDVVGKELIFHLLYGNSIIMNELRMSVNICQMYVMCAIGVQIVAQKSVLCPNLPTVLDCGSYVLLSMSHGIFMERGYTSSCIKGILTFYT